MSVTNNHIDYQQHNTGQQATAGDSMASPSANSTTLGSSNASGIAKGNSASSAGGSSTGGGTSSASDGTTQLLTKPRLQELVREIDPTEQLDEEVEELLLQIADDFVENTVNAACLLAKHRKVPKVEVRDVQLHLGT